MWQKLFEGTAERGIADVRRHEIGPEVCVQQHVFFTRSADGQGSGLPCCVVVHAEGGKISRIGEYLDMQSVFPLPDPGEVLTPDSIAEQRYDRKAIIYRVWAREVGHGSWRPRVLRAWRRLGSCWQRSRSAAAVRPHDCGYCCLLLGCFASSHKGVYHLQGDGELAYRSDPTGPLQSRAHFVIVVSMWRML